MPLDLERLLADADLGLELVAGRAGLRARGPVRWAHISEIPDPTPWLRGGEILLTTGLGVKDSPELQRRLVAGLDGRGCAAIGFGLGVYCEVVPGAMLAEADARELPLFTVPYEIPFIAVTEQVSHHIAAEHYATLRRAVDLHRNVLATVISGGGVKGVLQTVVPALARFEAVVFDYYGQVITAEGRSGPADHAALWEAIGAEERTQDRFTVPWRDREATGSWLRIGEQVEAVLVLVGDHELDERETLLMEQGLAGVTLELARGMSAREAHRSRVNEVLEEALTGRASHPILARQLERLGLDLHRPHRALALRRPVLVGERALCSLAEDVLGTVARPLVGRAGDLVYAIVQPHDAGYGERLAGAARARGWPALAVGRSRPKPNAEGLAAALREASAAVAAVPAAGGVLDVSELGMAGLLAGIGDDLASQVFVAQVLGPVLEHDARESTALADSLRSYLRHGCRPGPAAKELRVHRHTLAYRLDRVRDLTGRDPRDGEHLLEFALALELTGREQGGSGGPVAPAGDGAGAASHREGGLR